MAQKPLPSTKTFDWLTLSIYLSLVVIGWLMLYSTTYVEDQPYAYLDLTTDIGKQTVWVAIALIFFILTLAIEWNFWNTTAFFIYGFSLVLLVLVLIFGTKINGARAWFSLGFLSFQPAEIAKFGTCLALASFMSFNKYNQQDPRVLMLSVSIFLVPVVLILLQPDFGSAMVFASFTILLYRKGLSPLFFILAFSFLGIFILSLLFGAMFLLNLCLFLLFGFLVLSYKPTLPHIGAFAAAVVLFFVGINYLPSQYWWLLPLAGSGVYAFFNYKERHLRVLALLIPSTVIAIGLSFLTQFVFDNVLQPHQQERINVWLRPERCDPRGSLYNILQSKLAIGSGGLEGKGFLNGDMTKLDYVPEQKTDFIFTTIGEEQGFIGSVGVIILFLLLIIRTVVIAERAKLDFIRNFAYGFAGILFVHFFVNIGMTIGLIPVIGIPLPFLSKGGTALLMFSIFVGVLLRMDVSRSK